MRVLSIHNLNSSVAAELVSFLTDERPAAIDHSSTVGISTTQEQWERAMLQPQAMVLGARCEGVLCGVTVAQVQQPLLALPGRLSIEFIYVAQAWRRIGVGAALVQGLVDVAARHSCDTMVMSTVEDDRRAQRFLARWGFFTGAAPRVAQVSGLRRRFLPIPGQRGSSSVVDRRRRERGDESEILLSVPIPSAARSRDRDRRAIDLSGATDETVIGPNT